MIENLRCREKEARRGVWFCGMGKKDEALLLAMAAAPSDVDGGGKCDPAAATAATAAKKEVDVT